jgi:signal transduction histidine kinase
MKKRYFFKSIYIKFATIFIGIWWLLNTLTFSIIAYIMSHSILAKYSVNRLRFYHEFFRIRRLTVIIFIISAFVGTLLILIAIRGVVKPIRRLSSASKVVAKGNFEIEVAVTSKDELGQLTQDFNLMTKELKNIDVLRKDFVSNVSHEFKTPITSIKGYAKLIQEGNLPEVQLKEYSEIIVDESERLSLLSSNLLKLSELDSKLIREQSSLFSLDEQIRKAVLLLEVQWEKKEIDLDINLEEIQIKADEALLQEVWLNLIQNAIKFSKNSGQIKIELYQKEAQAVCKITDNGIGIADSEKARIFERFYKGDKSRSKEGNGLGLVIVKRIVELSGGKIYFESEFGKGSTFTVELPINE